MNETATFIEQNRTTDFTEQYKTWYMQHISYLQTGEYESARRVETMMSGAEAAAQTLGVDVEAVKTIARKYARSRGY